MFIYIFHRFFITGTSLVWKARCGRGWEKNDMNVNHELSNYYNQLSSQRVIIFGQEEPHHCDVSMLYNQSISASYVFLRQMNESHFCSFHTAASVNALQLTSRLLILIHTPSSLHNSSRMMAAAPLPSSQWHEWTKHKKLSFLKDTHNHLQLLYNPIVSEEMSQDIIW